MDIESFCMHGDLYWQGCYGSGVKYIKYVVPESTRHPAKMSFELLECIFKHMESMNLLDPKSVIIDFMAGSGRTNTMAALRGYRTISVELEPHFIEMQAGYDCNGKTITDFKIEPCSCGASVMHRVHKINTGLVEMECSGNPRIFPVCRCGSRHPHRKHHIPGNKEFLEQVTGRKVKWDIIRGDARELSRLLVLTDMVGVISPPYQDTAMTTGCSEHVRKLAREGKMGEAVELAKRAETAQVRKGNKFAVSTDENIERLIENALEREKGNYSENLENIGNLRDMPLVGITSPPFLEAQQGGGIAIRGYEGRFYYDQGNPDKVGQKCGYLRELHGSDPDNIGNQVGESYLQAMLKVYRQAFICGISPLVVVTKNPTRNGKLRRLDIDTVNLLQLSGYEIFDYHRAVLFESHTQETLEGDLRTKHRGRISFFKRLSIQAGKPIARWEDVIFARLK